VVEPKPIEIRNPSTQEIVGIQQDEVQEWISLPISISEPIHVILPELQFTDIQKNIFKYREYRERLREKFVWISQFNDHGSNLVASKTKAYAGRDSDMIDFGDTMWWMGFYLAMLATEYKLLENEWASTTKTLKELKYALDALERLDLYAESYYGWGNSRNGFLFVMTFHHFGILHVMLE
jgi:hypothetical protein